MGLALSLFRGQDFYVDDLRVTVEKVNVDSSFTLRAGNGPLVEVSRLFPVTLLPNVVVTVGQRVEPDVAKIVVDAPRSIVVILGSLYRNPKGKALDAYLFGNGKLHGPVGRQV